MNVADARILHLFANYKWTGPADPAIRAAARLRALGLDVTFAQGIVTHRGGEHRMAEELARAGVPVVVGLELRKHFHLGALLRDVRALRRLIARDRCDLLHCHLPADHLIAALAVRGLPQPPAIVRSLYDPEPPPRGLRSRAAFRATVGAIAPTRAAADGVVAGFGLPPGRVLLQPPVTEPRRLDGPDLRAAWGLDGRHRVVGITARIQPHRRFDLLWATARAVTRSNACRRSRRRPGACSASRCSVSMPSQRACTRQPPIARSFLPVRSISTIDMPGCSVATATPGKPLPVPRSSAWRGCSCVRANARPSSTCSTTACSRSRTAVRLICSLIVSIASR